MDWTRAEVVIDRFERMASINIRELKQLHRSIVECQRINDRESMVCDKRNASRKIDQLLAGLYQILDLRSKLNPDVQEKFDIRIEPIRMQIQTTVNSLSPICSLDIGTSPDETNIYSQMYDESKADVSKNVEQMQRQTRADSLRLRAEQAKADAEETKRLAKDIEDLNDIMVQLGQLVHVQHEVVDSIEEHVEKSRLEVQAGHNNLKKAQAANDAKVPLIAAAVGGVALGGPIGIAAGSAFAGVCAAVGGAVAGLYSGRVFKRKAQEAANRRD